MTDGTGRTRRRGAELEDAILDAAWGLLEDRGVEGLTFEAVAAAARTSKPVLYRRWPDRGSLFAATVRHRFRDRVLTVPDTGSLRGDVIDFLGQLNGKRAEMLMQLTAIGLYVRDIRPLTALHEGSRSSVRRIMDEIVRRARVRGEVTADLPDRVLAAPGEMLQVRILTLQGHVPPEEIRGIVDEVFLPLVAAYDARVAPDRS